MSRTIYVCGCRWVGYLTLCAWQRRGQVAATASRHRHVQNPERTAQPDAHRAVRQRRSAADRRQGFQPHPGRGTSLAHGTEKTPNFRMKQSVLLCRLQLRGRSAVRKEALCSCHVPCGVCGAHCSRGSCNSLVLCVRNCPLRCVRSAIRSRPRPSSSSAPMLPSSVARWRARLRAAARRRSLFPRFVCASVTVLKGGAAHSSACLLSLPVQSKPSYQPDIPEYD